MTTYLLLKYLHLIGFVYWLGGDFGTYLASRRVLNRDLRPESRQTALGIMLACDMGPRLAMPLMLPIGLHLAWFNGALQISTTGLVIVWVICLYWLSMVLMLHLKEGQPISARLAQIDLYFRMLVVAVLIAWIAVLAIGGESAVWAMLKLAIFAVLVLCGIALRLRLKPFGQAFAQMMREGASQQSEATIQASIQACRPWVWCIWAGLFVSAALGLRLVA